MEIKCPHCGTKYETNKSKYGKLAKHETCSKGFITGTSTVDQLCEDNKDECIN